MIKDPDGYGKAFPKNFYFHNSFVCTIEHVNFLISGNYVEGKVSSAELKTCLTLIQ